MSRGGIEQKLGGKCLSRKTSFYFETPCNRFLTISAKTCRRRRVVNCLFQHGCRLTSRCQVTHRQMSLGTAVTGRLYLKCGITESKMKRQLWLFQYITVSLHLTD
jgi:hypothetical protein